MRKIFPTKQSRGRQRRILLLAAGLSLVLFPILTSVALDVAAQTPTALHWESLGKNRIALWSFSPDFEKDGIVFFATSAVEKMTVRGVYQSADRGTTWKMTSDGLIPKKRHYYTVLVPSPDFTKDKTLWLFGKKTALETNEPFGAFWESTDGGLNWTEIQMKGFPYRELTTRVSQDVIGLVISPHINQDGIMVAAVGGEGVYISKDKGRNWELLNAIKDVTNIYAPPSFPEEPFLALATSGNQVMISTDGGKTFETRGNGLPDSMKEVGGIAFSSNFAKDRKMFCFGSAGVFAFDDAGQTWKTLAVSETTVSFTAMAVSGDFVDYGAIAYGTDDNKIYLSDDMGKTFQSVGSETLMNYKVDTLAFAPDYKTTRQLFASSQDGIFRYGPALNQAALSTSQANASDVEGTRVARSTAASGLKFVPKQSNRVETGCFAYTVAPIAMLLVYGFTKKGRTRD